MTRRVVVVGSGAAGMAAAVSAASEGAAVTLLEAASVLGGTTTISGGTAWVPANRYAAEAGVADSPEEAQRYVRALDLGDVDLALADRYVREGSAVIGKIADRTPVRWEMQTGWPDYHSERDGGKAEGRSLAVGLVEAGAEALRTVRPDPYGAPLMTINEESVPPDSAELDRRARESIACRGRGIIAGMHAALLDLGGQVRTDARVTSLLRSGDAVVGVEADGVRHSGEVVLTTGGFERDPGLVRSFLRGPMLAPGGAPTNRGDGLRMGMAAGAALGNMSEAWWCPSLAVPRETIEGAPFYRMLFLDCGQPGGLLVDGAGRRFVNEAANYNDLGRALQDFDANYAFPRVPSWLVLDARRRAHVLGPLTPDAADPEWLLRDETLEGLAARMGIPPGALRESVDRFNGHAASGVDTDFGRGSFRFDRFSAASDALEPVAQAPFYAFAVLPGCLSTKGGLRTDEHGRVRHVDGGVVPGLHAAGGAAASPFGCAYPGAGATIGPALAFGWFAGRAASAA